MTLEQLFTAIDRFGVATVLLIGLLWIIYRLGKIFITKVAMPVADAHIGFVKDTTSHMGRIADNQEAISAKQDQVLDKIDYWFEGKKLEHDKPG